MAGFERACSVCGHVHVGPRATLARLSTCVACGAQLPPGVRVHAGGAPASSPSEDDVGPAPAERWELACPRCGHRHEGTPERLRSLWYCEACGEPLEGARATPAAPGPGPASLSRVAVPNGAANPRGAASPVAASPSSAASRASFSPDALCLRLADADVREGLPVPPSGEEGLFGRLTAQSPALASLRTLSRRQFAYRYRDDGSLEVRNLSQFGTRVAGELLAELGATAVARPPAVIEMAGATFSLERM